MAEDKEYRQDVYVLPTEEGQPTRGFIGVMQSPLGLVALDGPPQRAEWNGTTWTDPDGGTIDGEDGMALLARCKELGVEL